MTHDRQGVKEPRRPYDVPAQGRLCAACGERPCIAGSTLCFACDEMWWRQLTREDSAAVTPRAFEIIGAGICGRCGVYGSLAAPHHYCPACNRSWQRDRAAACAWARTVLADDASQYVVLDTETTGIHATAEIVDIAILEPDGHACFDSLVRPRRPIPPDATAIHHITDAMVMQAPTFPQIYTQIARHLRGRKVIVYNAQFDQARLFYALRAHRLPSLGELTWECAMQRYASYTGAWNSRYRNYSWQRLPGAGHRARGDCQATLALLARIARG
jgi:DNA polymerase III epsilon subunit-like protein